MMSNILNLSWVSICDICCKNEWNIPVVLERYFEAVYGKERKAISSFTSGSDVMSVLNVCEDVDYMKEWHCMFCNLNIPYNEMITMKTCGNHYACKQCWRDHITTAMVSFVDENSESMSYYSVQQSCIPCIYSSKSPNKLPCSCCPNIISTEMLMNIWEEACDENNKDLVNKYFSRLYRFEILLLTKDCAFTLCT
jgi:hypothetical protein